MNGCGGVCGETDLTRSRGRTGIKSLKSGDWVCVDKKNGTEKEPGLEQGTSWNKWARREGVRLTGCMGTGRRVYDL